MKEYANERCSRRCPNLFNEELPGFKQFLSSTVRSRSHSKEPAHTSTWGA